MDGLQDLGELPTELEWFSWMDHMAQEACKLERKKKKKLRVGVEGDAQRMEKNEK